MVGDDMTPNASGDADSMTGEKQQIANNYVPKMLIFLA
jgi:hypothetical protein